MKIDSPNILAELQELHTLPATDIAEKEFRPIVTNIVMLGFMAARLEHLSYEAVKSALVAARAAAGSSRSSISRGRSLRMMEVPFFQ